MKFIGTNYFLSDWVRRTWEIFFFFDMGIFKPSNKITKV